MNEQGAGTRTSDPPYQADIDAEGQGWHEFTSLVRQLTANECLEPGYYRDPDWAIRDLAAHLGTWLAEADRQFQQMLAGTYAGHGDVDVDGLNAWLLDAMRASHGTWCGCRRTQPDRRCARTGCGWTPSPTRQRGGSRSRARHTTPSTCRAFGSGSRSCWGAGREAVRRPASPSGDDDQPLG